MNDPIFNDVYGQTYGHTPVKKAFGQGDVYGIRYDQERASRRKIRLGIIGAGGVAQSKYFPAIARLRALWEPIEIVAFAEPDEQQAKKVQEIYGGVWYSDYRKMLAEMKLDGVIVTSPDDLHAQHARDALQAGFPVLVEKPITRSLYDAWHLCSLAQEKGLLLMTVSNKRYSPPYRRAKLLIDQGPLKNPALYVAKFNLGYQYVDLLEQGTIHIFDITRYLMGDVRSVRCIGVKKYENYAHYYPIDNAVVTLEFCSGSVGTIYTSSSALSFKPWEMVEVYADHTWLKVDDQYRLTLYDSEEGPTKSWEPVLPNTLFFDEEFGGFMGMIENFAQAIRGVEIPLVTGWDGYRAYEILAACELSLAKGGQVIQLPLDPLRSEVKN